ncbi:MAG: sigma 54-interacting transcriptional regulator [Spirochaetes bacterium]|nr:sigma 54-interacting transcriptional regulator [Spirochaetota bacterium]
MKANELSYNELSCLYEITKLIISTNDINIVLKDTLIILSDMMNLKRGIISIYNKSENKIFHDSFGFKDPDEIIKFDPGEGITGKVIESGIPIGIPRLDKEPLFLDKTGIRKSLNRRELSFICVPIKYNDENVGALSVDMRAKEEDYDLAKEIKFLSNVAELLSETVNKRSLYAENLQLRDMLKKSSPVGTIVGNSKTIRDVSDQILTVSKSNISVLITGETGTGKELVAKEIHTQSKRGKNPFIVVNCGAIPEGVIESELFGHVKGAFTGALGNRVGKFEAANNGTIFLDEIAELSLQLQVKLLRVLQEKEITRVGENNTRKINVRILAATNKNLDEEIQKGTFRQDLYYRLNGFHIYVPPLRERGSDIILLADYFIQKYSKELGKIITRLDTPSIDMLMKYHWPGNVRELENCIERACLLTNDDTIHSHNLPPSLQMKSVSAKDQKLGKFDLLVKNYEIELITEALKLTNGNQAKAAELLDTTKRILQYKINIYDLDYKRYRNKK